MVAWPNSSPFVLTERLCLGGPEPTVVVGVVVVVVVAVAVAVAAAAAGVVVVGRDKNSCPT